MPIYEVLFLVMAAKFKLNTAGFATLTQVVIGMPSGEVYDHLKRNAAGTVDLTTNTRDAAAARAYEIGGVKTLAES